MNILQINTHDVAGGAARVMLRLHQGLERSGHESRLLVRKRTTTSTYACSVADVIGEKRTLRNRLLTQLGVRADAWFGMPNLYFSTKRILKTDILQLAEVLHLHNLHGRYFNYHLLPMFSACKPIVWTLHDMWAFTGHCAYSYDCERWRTGCFTCPLLEGSGRGLVEPKPTWVDRTRQVWHTKRRLYQKTALHIVTPSQWLCDLAKESILGEALSIQCISNGIDLDVFRPLDQAMARDVLGIPLDSKVLLFVAARVTTKRKGLSYLLDALEGIEDTESIVLLSIGAGDVSMGPLARFCCRNLGPLFDERLLSLVYSAADLFVFPTLADNQPLVLLEAMACGTPIVSFDVGGVPEMVRHMDTGYLARYEDIGDLRRGICTLLEDGELGVRLRSRCRETAEAEYDLNLQVQRYLTLYEQAVEQHLRQSGPRSQ